MGSQASSSLSSIVAEWYQSKVVSEKQWLEHTVEKYVRKLKAQAFIEEELKKETVPDDFDLSAITLDFARQKLEFERLFHQIEQRIESIEDELNSRTLPVDEWIRKEMISTELWQYFREKRRLLEHYLQQLKKLREITAPNLASLRSRPLTEVTQNTQSTQATRVTQGTPPVTPQIRIQ
jgi:hypothetical protein